MADFSIGQLTSSPSIELTNTTVQKVVDSKATTFDTPATTGVSTTALDTSTTKSIVSQLSALTGVSLTSQTQAVASTTSQADASNGAPAPSTQVAAEIMAAIGAQCDTTTMALSTQSNMIVRGAQTAKDSLSAVGSAVDTKAGQTFLDAFSVSATNELKSHIQAFQQAGGVHIDVSNAKLTKYTQEFKAVEGLSQVNAAHISWSSKTLSTQAGTAVTLHDNEHKEVAGTKTSLNGSHTETNLSKAVVTEGSHSTLAGAVATVAVKAHSITAGSTSQESTTDKVVVDDCQNITVKKGQTTTADSITKRTSGLISLLSTEVTATPSADAGLTASNEVGAAVAATSATSTTAATSATSTTAAASTTTDSTTTASALGKQAGIIIASQSSGQTNGINMGLTGLLHWVEAGQSILHFDGVNTTTLSKGITAIGSMVAVPELGTSSLLSSDVLKTILQVVSTVKSASDLFSSCLKKPAVAASILNNKLPTGITQAIGRQPTLVAIKNAVKSTSTGTSTGTTSTTASTLASAVTSGISSALGKTASSTSTGTGTTTAALSTTAADPTATSSSTQKKQSLPAGAPNESSTTTSAAVSTQQTAFSAPVHIYKPYTVPAATTTTALSTDIDGNSSTTVSASSSSALSSSAKDILNNVIGVTTDEKTALTKTLTSGKTIWDVVSGISGTVTLDTLKSTTGVTSTEAQTIYTLLQTNSLSTRLSGAVTDVSNIVSGIGGDDIISTVLGYVSVASTVYSTLTTGSGLGSLITKAGLSAASLTGFSLGGLLGTTSTTSSALSSSGTGTVAVSKATGAGTTDLSLSSTAATSTTTGTFGSTASSTSSSGTSTVAVSGATGAGTTNLSLSSTASTSTTTGTLGSASLNLGSTSLSTVSSSGVTSTLTSAQKSALSLINSSLTSSLNSVLPSGVTSAALKVLQSLEVGSSIDVTALGTALISAGVSNTQYASVVNSILPFAKKIVAGDLMGLANADTLSAITSALSSSIPGFSSILSKVSSVINLGTTLMAIPGLVSKMQANNIPLLQQLDAVFNCAGLFNSIKNVISALSTTSSSSSSSSSTSSTSSSSSTTGSTSSTTTSTNLQTARFLELLPRMIQVLNSVAADPTAAVSEWNTYYSSVGLTSTTSVETLVQDLVTAQASMPTGTACVVVPTWTTELATVHVVGFTTRVLAFTMVQTTRDEAHYPGAGMSLVLFVTSYQKSGASLTVYQDTVDYTPYTLAYTILSYDPTTNQGTAILNTKYSKLYLQDSSGVLAEYASSTIGDTLIPHVVDSYILA